MLQACLQLCLMGLISVFGLTCEPVLQTAHILYSGIMPWLVADGMAGAILAPVVFAMLTLLGAITLLALYVATLVSPYCMLTICTRYCALSHAPPV
jgi:hypothetical protein